MPANAIGIMFPSSNFCHNDIPSPVVLASVFFSKVLSVGLFAPKVLVGNEPIIVLLREMISVYSCILEVLILALLPPFLSLGLIPFLLISCPKHFVWLMNISDFLFALYPAFSYLFKMANRFFSWSCSLPRVTTIISSN